MPRMPSVLQPLAWSAVPVGKGGSSKSMGTCGGAPSSFLRVAGRRGEQRPSRLYLALPNWDLSQRPGRVLVRLFGVVAYVPQSSEFTGFTPYIFAVAQNRCPATWGAPEVARVRPRDVRGLHGATGRLRGPDPDAVAAPRRHPVPAAVPGVDRAGPRVELIRQ